MIITRSSLLRRPLCSLAPLDPLATKKVKGCTTLIPPTEVLRLSENSVRDICGAVWVGCFTANPSEVTFDLLCRLMR